MGYDVYANGEWTVKADKIEGFKLALLKQSAEKDGYESVDEWAEAEDFICDPRTEFVGWCQDRFDESLCVYITDEDISISFCDDSMRDVEDYRWVFELAAPFAEEGDCIGFQGDDGYKWSWDVVRGKFEEMDSAVVYGPDVNAPDTIQKIVELVYPEGRPVTADALEAFQWEQIVVKIEDLLREAGFGPQAGMNELDRLAQV